MVLGDLGIDQFAAMGFEPREGAFLILAHQPAISRGIGHKYRRQSAFNPLALHTASPHDLFAPLRSRRPPSFGYSRAQLRSTSDSPGDRQGRESACATEMTRVVYSRRAAAEVDEITAFLAKHIRSAAERFLEALGRAEQQLSPFPNSGSPGLCPGMRRVVVVNYIVSRRRRGAEVEIFAVRNARQRDARP